MKAMVLAAGLGTRMRPLSDLVAKPAVPIGPRTLLEWILRHLQSQGVEEAIVNLHHLPGTIREALARAHDLKIRVAFSEEPELLGTSGALANAARHFTSEEIFIMVNGDALFDFNLGAACEAHRRSGASATMVLVPSRAGYGLVEVNEGWVSRISGRPESGRPGKPYHFSGVHILSTELLDHLPAGASEINREIYPRLIERGFRIGGWISDCEWYDFGSPAAYRENALLYLSSKGVPVGPFVAGERTRVDADSRVTESILWDDVQVSNGAVVERCIVTSGTLVRGGQHAGRILMPGESRPIQ